MTKPTNAKIKKASALIQFFIMYGPLNVSMGKEPTEIIAIATMDITRKNLCPLRGIT